MNDERRDAVIGVMKEMASQSMMPRKGNYFASRGLPTEGDYQYAALVHEARLRGYKPGWVRFKFKELYGRFPKTREEKLVQDLIAEMELPDDVGGIDEALYKLLMKRDKEYLEDIRTGLGLTNAERR